MTVRNAILKIMGRRATPPRSGNEIRLNIPMDKELHRRLKSALALKEKTIRGWVIEQAEATVAETGATAEPKAKP